MKRSPHAKHIGAAATFLYAGDFQCAACRAWVSANPLLSGVQNRNHCPFCLSSRHVDLHHAGDRLCACKAIMQPIGLTTKKKHDKYAPEGNGELMLIHQCRACGSFSLNRIAADDDPQALYQVFLQSANLPADVQWQLAHQHIQLLRMEDKARLRARLFGMTPQPLASLAAA
ncbi:MAG: RNHCP domain-containing protein [Longilinea sp.]|nr:RNHCP domain-containing protein [Longilinea sp.]MCA1954135.1 RNHCP domain-containing protein [Anaerolinea sp.]